MSGPRIINIPYIDDRINSTDLLFTKKGIFLKENKYSTRLDILDIKDKTNPKKTYIQYKKKPLGEGGFGTVYLAQNADTQEWIAIKEPKKKMSDRDIYREVEHLEGNKELIFFDLTSKRIGMKLKEGVRLSDITKISLSQLSWVQLIYIAKNILVKTAHLHQDHESIKAYYADPTVKTRNRLLHRDIKPDNILLNQELTIDYCDFGFVEKVPTHKDDPTPFEKGLNTATGTLDYMAPEIHSRNNEKFIYNEQTEIYALSVTLEKLFAKKLADRRDLIQQNTIEAQIVVQLNSFISKMRVSGVDDKGEPLKRPIVLECISFFNNLLSEAGSDADPIHACILSIDELLRLSTEDYAILIDNLFKEPIHVHAIVLQGTSTTTANAYYQARHLLSKSNIINVEPFMVQSDKPQDGVAVVKRYYDTKYCTVNSHIFTQEGLSIKQALLLNKETPLKSYKTTTAVATGLLTGLLVVGVFAGIAIFTAGTMGVGFFVMLGAGLVMGAVIGTSVGVSLAHQHKKESNPNINVTNSIENGTNPRGAVLTNNPRLSQQYMPEYENDSLHGKNRARSPEETVVLLIQYKKYFINKIGEDKIFSDLLKAKIGTSHDEIFHNQEPLLAKFTTYLAGGAEQPLTHFLTEHPAFCHTLHEYIIINKKIIDQYQNAEREKDRLGLT